MRYTKRIYHPRVAPRNAIAASRHPPQPRAVAVNWYKWQLKDDKDAARMFSGPDCVLCREPTWHVQKKNMK